MNSLVSINRSVVVLTQAMGGEGIFTSTSIAEQLNTNLAATGAFGKIDVFAGNRDLAR